MDMVINMKIIFDNIQINKTLRRITHEIIEKNNNIDNLIILGVVTKGVPIANIIQNNIKQFANIDVPVIPIDITDFRDDQLENRIKPNKNSEYDFTNKMIVIVDDVLYTGRTVRAALDLITYHGRPSKIELAVLIDRGHRELPIRADYVGKNIPTSQDEKVFFEPESLTVFLK